MSEDKNNLVVSYNHIVKDIFDNYDRYTDTEKSSIKKVLSDLYNLNKTLNKYDKKPRPWEDEAEKSYSRFFN